MDSVSQGTFLQIWDEKYFFPVSFNNNIITTETLILIFDQC